jgi:hypothetical protein
MDNKRYYVCWEHIPTKEKRRGIAVSYEEAIRIVKANNDKIVDPRYTPDWIENENGERVDAP